MLANIFNNNKPLTWALLFLLSLGGGFWVLNQHPLEGSRFYFAGYSTSISPTLHSIIWPLSLSAMVLIFNFLITERLELLKRSSYLGYVYAMLVGFWYTGSFSLSTFAAAFTFLTAAYQLAYSGPFHKISGQLFNAGFFLGLSATFEPALSWMIIPFIAVLIILGHAQFRYITLLILGQLTPWIALAEISYLLGDWDLYADFYHSLFDLPSGELEWSKQISWAFTTVMGLAIILAAKEYTVALAKAKIYKKQGFNTFWIFLIAFVLLSILIPEKALTFLFMAQIPLSVLFTNYLQYLRKKWLLEGLLWILILINLLSTLLYSL